MANPEQLAVLKQGAAAWNGWRAEHIDILPALADADLAGLNLNGANLAGGDLSRTQLKNSRLIGTNLNRAKLNGANLEAAMLIQAHLNGADLRGADLLSASLSGADLRGTELAGADLSWTFLTSSDFSMARVIDVDFNGADLRGANFTGATMRGAFLLGNDLSSTQGLETVKHLGPSRVAIDTVYLSSGKIPEVFLRGAGVPDSFITYMHSLAGTAIEFYSCFISYSTKDQDFAERLYADLQANNVRCWFAPHDIQSGKKIHEQIDEAIRLHDKLLLILSPDSIKSAWVETEIAKARRREMRDERRVLFPVRLVDFEALKNWECFDADTGKDSAREIREYFVPDFSGWKNHDSYQRAFQRLLKDLKAG